VELKLILVLYLHYHPEEGNMVAKTYRYTELANIYTLHLC